MGTLLIEIAVELLKAVIKIILVGVAVTVAGIVFVIVREIAWLVQQENRKQFEEKQDRDRKQD